MSEKQSCVIEPILFYLWEGVFRVRTAITQRSLPDTEKPRPDSITFPVHTPDVAFTEALPEAHSKDPVRALGTDFSLFFKV